MLESKSSEMNASQSFIVASLGSRMSYAVPRILHSHGLLERLFTDLCASKGWMRALGAVPRAWRPAGLRRLLSRVPPEIPANRITHFPWIGWRYGARRRMPLTVSQLPGLYLRTNSAFCRAVCEQDWGAARGVYTYNGAGLEILAQARARGLFTVMEQASAPADIDARIMAAERRAFPGYETAPDDTVWQAHAEREKSEWRLADLIICGSEFVREGFRACGGPVERCVVVPYGIDLPTQAPPRSTPHNGGSLRVLTSATVGLRKGVQYVMQAAAALGDRAEFRLLGTLDSIPPAIRAELKAHLHCLGHVPRNEIWKHYGWADVFLLPSLCEGSATVAYEALACGLPVVTTANSGTVVRDGVDGYIVPIRNSAAIVECLQRLAADRELRDRISQSARERAREFTLKKYDERLCDVLMNAQVQGSAGSQQHRPNEV
jgi:glycosyltransferase involved in cell wall biosynthesis